MSDKTKTVAVAGNPNVGKSTLFNALTGMNQHTGNWAGKTVSSAKGRIKANGKEYVLVDIPGTYSLFSRSPEEEVARDFLINENPDGVIVVCDATCLERSLILVLQIKKLTENIIVCVNLLDEAEKKGIKIDLQKLSEILGLCVVGTVARKKKTLNLLVEQLKKFENTNKKEFSLEEIDDKVTVEIVNKAHEISKETVTFTKKEPDSFDRKADKILTSKHFGYPIMILLLGLVFWITVVGANYISQGLSAVFEAIENFLKSFLDNANAPPLLKEIIIDGIYRVPAWVISVMLPPMAIFFPLFTFLEDIGYLPRIAFNLDKPFKKCQSCGKQALTMCMGFGCNAAGVVGTRIIDSPRERLLGIITNTLVPCNGRFPAIIALISVFFVTANTFLGEMFSALILTLVILLGVGMTFLSTKILSLTVLKGIPSSYTLEMPPYRKPQIAKILLRSVFDRTLFVLGRAVSVAIPAGIVIWSMANFCINGKTLLTIFSEFLDPMGRLLGLDGVIILGFILGFPANEIVLPIILMAYTASGKLTDMPTLYEMQNILINNGWTVLTAINTIVFSLFHWPCSTTVLTIKKESGSLKWTVFSVIFPTALGIIICFITTFIWNLFL